MHDANCKCGACMGGKMCGMCGCDMNAKGHGMACGCMVLGKLLFALGLVAAVIAIMLAFQDSTMWGFDAIIWYLNAIVLMMVGKSCKSCSHSMKMKMMMAGGNCGGGNCGMGGGACCDSDKESECCKDGQH